MHFFKIYETSVSRAIKQVKLFLQQCELREWSYYTILGTLDIGTDKFYSDVKDTEALSLVMLTNRKAINKMLTDFVSAENFNKKKEFLLDFIMGDDWASAGRVCRDLAGTEYAMGRKIDVADLDVPVINGENVIEPGLSKIGIGPVQGVWKTVYLVEVAFDA